MVGRRVDMAYMVCCHSNLLVEEGSHYIRCEHVRRGKQQTEVIHREGGG